ncbi:hypothetical protein ACFQUU_19380 [Herbaspirillum sp. GCM10030257]|uniref:hypothetical protein n=1 Tax=Herbaspirillum sp. GCM10030257 TaxID=3273393 RepID=UPI00361EA4C9
MKRAILAAVCLTIVSGTALAQSRGNGNGNGNGGGTSSAVPVLVDSTGKVVGRYVGNQVLVSYNGSVLPLMLGSISNGSGYSISSGFTWQYSNVFYTSADCSGQAHLIMSAVGSRLTVSVAPQGNQTIAYFSNAQSPVSMDVNSMRMPNGNCSSQQFTAPTVPVNGTFSLDTYGIPPFYVQ